MNLFSVDYLIIGAGPAGLQLAYFLDKANRNYLILESGNSVGTFFRKYPRHGQLISINKVYTGYEDPEINLRWDWNSLLSDQKHLKLSHFSQDYFPDTSSLVRYLETYQQELDLKIHFNTHVNHIQKVDGDFCVDAANGNTYHAKHLVIATGLSKAYVPPIPGIELAENYIDVSVNPEDFINQRVLIVGKGNSGFETADNLISRASLIHIVSPKPIKMAWRTKYVGHLRAVNNNFLDTYQLKSQNGVLDADIVNIERHGDEFRVEVSYTHADGEKETLTYDRVIVCAGFRFDHSIFDESCKPMLTINDRFPAQTSEWESVNVPGLYFAGVLMHMRDFKKKQSGFIHGFRHNIQALHQILESKYHQNAWPYKLLHAKADEITQAILNRVNSSAGLWQQTGFLCDLIVIDEERDAAFYYQDLPKDYVHGSRFGKSRHYYTVTLEFGADVHQVSDPFSINRVHKEDAPNAAESEFIHPIIRRYSQNTLISEHHVIEDLEAEWKEPVHIEPLKQFIKMQLCSGSDSPVNLPVFTDFLPRVGISSNVGLNEVIPVQQNVPNLEIDQTERSFIKGHDKGSNTNRRIGDYLIESGLLNRAQLQYALSEQVKTQMRLGEIISQHGWINQHTIDFLVTELNLDRSTSESKTLKY